MKLVLSLLLAGALAPSNVNVLFAKEKTENHGFRYRITILYEDGVTHTPFF